MAFLKRATIYILAAAMLFFLLSYHFIFIGNTVKLLRKSKLTLKYTIYSVKGKSNKTILSREELWEAGIGDLLVKMGRMSKEELAQYEEKEYSEEEEY